MVRGAEQPRRCEEDPGFSNCTSQSQDKSSRGSSPGLATRWPRALQTRREAMEGAESDVCSMTQCGMKTSQTLSSYQGGGVSRDISRAFIVNLHRLGRHGELRPGRTLNTTTSSMPARYGFISGCRILYLVPFAWACSILRLSLQSHGACWCASSILHAVLRLFHPSLLVKVCVAGLETVTAAIVGLPVWNQQAGEESEKKSNGPI